MTPSDTTPSLSISLDAGRFKSYCMYDYKSDPCDLLHCGCVGMFDDCHKCINNGSTYLTDAFAAHLATLQAEVAAEVRA